MSAQNLLTTLGAMTKDQLIAEVTKREEMIHQYQTAQLHLSDSEQYNALVNAMRERDQHAENKNKEVAAHEETKRKHAEHVAALANGHELDKAAALKKQYADEIIPLKKAEHARQVEELKRRQDAELGAL